MPLVALACIALLCPAIAAAEGNEHPSDEVLLTSDAEHGRNHIAAILGYAAKSGSTDGPTGGKHAVIYGIEYQYRIHDRFSLGLFYEQSSGDFDAESFGIPASIFVTEEFKILLAVGSERKLFEEDDEIFYRLGLGYDIELERVTVSPSGWVDFVNGKEIYFLGLTVGFGF